MVYGTCCAGLSNQCGCMGMPVGMECSMCDGSGLIEIEPTSELIESLKDFITEQTDIDEHMKQYYLGESCPSGGFITPSPIS